jgi:hypothetical protein
MYDAKQSLTRLIKSESNAMVEKLDRECSGLGTKQPEPPLITAAAERISKMVEDGLSTHRSFTGRSRSPRLSPKWNPGGATYGYAIFLRIFPIMNQRQTRHFFHVWQHRSRES